MKGVKKQVKKLKNQVRDLQQQIDNLSREPGPQGPQGAQGPAGPSTGPAGGDLTGTFPNPLIAPNAVGSAEIEDDAVKSSEIAPDAVTGSEIATDAVGSGSVSDESLFASDLAATSVRASEIDTGAVGAFELADTIAVVGTGVPVTAAGGAVNATVVCPVDTHRTILSGGFAWQDDNETSTIISSAPSENFPFNRWEVRGMVETGSNVLFPWALCIESV